jgi:type II secretory ATPase GspE/PulE/Tfp pilus assembly ATPase PilB-like protein
MSHPSITKLQNPLAGPFAVLLQRAATRDPQFATDFVNAVIRVARDAGASDVHLDPTAEALQVRWRLDGVLQPMVQMPRDVAANVTARLKVLAGLLTYESVLPQEGRIWDQGLRAEVRVSTFPTLYGERCVLRLLGASRESLDSLPQLGLPADVVRELEKNLASTSGAILIVGPAGSGKTTTAYACLRHVVAITAGGRSIASLEDPIEVAVDGVSQTQVNLAADFDMATGLRSLLRLDPEVILIGEMRDRPTAEIALQAALTGQLAVTTFHAGDCRDAINRLIDLGIPTFAVRNAVRLVVAQRLLRRLCSCALPGEADRDARPLGIDANHCWIPGACDDCHHTGFRGRTLVAEYQTVGGADPTTFDMPADRNLWASAQALVEQGATTAAEVVRVLGLRRD